MGRHARVTYLDFHDPFAKPLFAWLFRESWNDWYLGAHGARPLPHSPSKTGVNALMGERVGVRGFQNSRFCNPSPGAPSRADLSLWER